MIRLDEVYESQIKFQESLKGTYHFDFDKLPADIPEAMGYHVLSLISEVGELLASDKRWKNMRNKDYNKDDKLDELADCFIFLLNIAIFSGFSDDELMAAVAKKINRNFQRCR